MASPPPPSRGGPPLGRQPQGAAASAIGRPPGSVSPVRGKRLSYLDAASSQKRPAIEHATLTLGLVLELALGLVLI